MIKIIARQELHISSKAVRYYHNVHSWLLIVQIFAIFFVT